MHMEKDSKTNKSLLPAPLLPGDYLLYPRWRQGKMAAEISCELERDHQTCLLAFSLVTYL